MTSFKKFLEKYQRSRDVRLRKAIISSRSHLEISFKVLSLTSPLSARSAKNVCTPAKPNRHFASHRPNVVVEKRLCFNTAPKRCGARKCYHVNVFSFLKMANFLNVAPRGDATRCYIVNVLSLLENRHYSQHRPPEVMPKNRTM